MLSASAALNASSAAQSVSVDESRVHAPLAAPTSETDTIATSGVLVSTPNNVRVETALSESKTPSEAVHFASSVSVSTQVSRKRANRRAPTSPLAQRSAKRSVAGPAEPEVCEVSNSPEIAPAQTPLKTPTCAALAKFAYVEDESPNLQPPLRASTAAHTPVPSLSSTPSDIAGRSFELLNAPALPASAFTPAVHIDLFGDELGAGAPATPLRYPHLFETRSSFVVPPPSTNAAADEWERELDTSSIDQ